MVSLLVAQLPLINGGQLYHHAVRSHDNKLHNLSLQKLETSNGSESVSHHAVQGNAEWQ